MGTGPAGSVFGKNLFYRKTRGTRLEGRHVAKRNSDPGVAYPEIKVQVRDLVHVVGIVASFAPRESVFGDTSFYRAPGGKWAQETCAVYPQQRYAPGEPGKAQGRDRVGIVKSSCGYRARGVSVQGKFVLSRNPGYKTSGVAMWLNDVLIPGQPTPKSKFRYGT